MSKWFKIWDIASKNDGPDGLYLKLIKEDKDTNDIQLAIVDRMGEVYKNNIILNLSETMKSIVFYGIDDDIPLKSDLRSIPLSIDYIEMRVLENNYRGVSSIEIPMNVMQEMAEKVKEKVEQQKKQHDKETKH